MNISMLDLAAEQRELSGELEAAIKGVLASGHFILGPQGAAFENEIAAWLGVGHAVAVASGTDALHLALRAAGVGPGDEVVTPAFTFIATAQAISYCGARPVFADIDPGTFNLDPSSLARVLTPRTRAVIAVHLYGQCADMGSIAAVCEQRGLTLIEDCAQAIGADWQGRRAGAWGALGCFSFYPTKNLGAYGDAGLITTGDAKLAETLRVLRHHGSRVAYRHEMIGYNSRMDELQAAILRVKLRRLEAWNAARRGHAEHYRRLLAGSTLVLPSEHGRGSHAYHQFTLRSARRDAMREALTRAGIASAIYYPIPLHHQPVYEREHGGLSLPVSEEAARTVFAVPVYPQLTADRLERVCEVLLTA
ncbi:MAG: DegT/DnrJ/EryC1/StrS family aminotransferase [Betaproteobacteria bacterium]|nr:DegT/DnrJ/EryC1/StrS family aminotransferase [Betaproteobacteria bacterium]